MLETLSIHSANQIDRISGTQAANKQGTMTSYLTRQKHAKERLGAALQKMNDATRDVHKSGIDVDISTLTIHTPRGPMVQVDLKTFRAYDAPPVLRLVEE
ncbi:hypothetical protein RWK44_32415 [Rhizobium sp. 25PS6]|uniref:Uncharacterized protein n=1 Tax=Rhizobium hidalgonense TaxID=1538159 RepID=A0AAJ2LQR2_9HYPH|nr:MULTISPECIES: hypothetical protein [Rhizobium]MDR9777044.1 hypothetical protein [Rhizobium hidalgonense]MDR9823513.1 hypothetical protein [Rhizobium hidalgonense]MDU0365079.1 hypothetical protein [Rhizobium sp. 25PS6]